MIVSEPTSPNNQTMLVANTFQLKTKPPLLITTSLVSVLSVVGIVDRVAWLKVEVTT